MDYDADEEEEEEMDGEYTHVTLQLLDLMHTLHTRAAGVHQVHTATAYKLEHTVVDLGIGIYF